MFLIHFHGAQKVEKVLRAVLPWLVTKHRVAEHVLQMIEHRKRMGYHERSLSDPVLGGMLGVLRALNRRGVVPGDGGQQVSAQFPACQLDGDQSRMDVVGGRQGAQHPHRVTGTVSG